VRANSYSLEDDLPAENGTLEPPEREQWVVLRVEVWTMPGDDIRIGYPQRSVVDFQDVAHTPDDEAMREFGTFPNEQTLAPNSDAEEHRVIFAGEDSSDGMLKMERYCPLEGSKWIVHTGG
jgi:hypothetical protein